MSILVFGKTGQVANELRKLDSPAQSIIALGRFEADLAKPESCVAAIKHFKPNAVINAAAYTAVDRAEEELDLAVKINGTTPGEMARTCAAIGIPFIQLSTDYVFDGTGNTSWQPHSPVAPISAYGLSKRLGEEEVAKAGGRYVILRTSWVFSAHGQNFVKTMLRLGSEHEQLSIVADQIGGPTPASAIAQACLRIADALAKDPNKSGIYHFSGLPDVSWADFARAVFTETGLTCNVKDIETAEYFTPARRPANSRLDCSATESTFGIRRPDWQAELVAVLRELT